MDRAHEMMPIKDRSSVSIIIAAIKHSRFFIWNQKNLKTLYDPFVMDLAWVERNQIASSSR